MTTAADETYDEPLQFGGGATGRDKSNDHVPFHLGDGDEDPFVYEAHRPKMKILLRLAAVMDDDTNPLKQAAAVEDLLTRILSPESNERLNERLEDPDDDLDYDSPGIENMLRTLLGLWYERPTGARPASRGSRSRTGRASTVRSRSQGPTPKT